MRNSKHAFTKHWILTYDLLTSRTQCKWISVLGQSVTVMQVDEETQENIYCAKPLCLLQFSCPPRCQTNQFSGEQAHLEFAEHMWWARILSTTASVLWERSTCPESEMFIMLGTLAKIWYCHSKIVLSLLQLTMLLKYFPLPSSYRAEINRQENKFSQEFFFSHFHGKFTLLIWNVFVFRSSWYVSYPNSLTIFLWTSCLIAYPKAMIIYISTTYKKRLKVKLCLLRENNERTCHCSTNSMIMIYTWLLSSYIILSFQKDQSIPKSALWEMMIMWPLLGE